MPGDRLLEAVLAARGDRSASGVSDPDLAFAQMLVAARRLDTEEPGCPERARHRAHRLFDRLPEGLWESLARLVFDSWRPEDGGEPIPATRSLGTERLMIYESGVGSLDLQLSQSPEDDGITLVLAIQGGGDGLEARLEVDGRPGPRVGVDEHGTGSVRLGTGHREVVVVVQDVDGEILRTPVVPLT